MQGDVRDSLEDIPSAGDKLGYKRDFDLNMGLEAAVEWFMKNGQSNHLTNEQHVAYFCNK